jgi:hypothetical protein
MARVARNLTDPFDGFLVGKRYLNAYAERFVLSIKSWDFPLG